MRSNNPDLKFRAMVMKRELQVTRLGRV